MFAVTDLETKNIEINLLLSAIYQKYGYDFRNYARASLQRRIKRHLDKTGLATITDMQREVIHNSKFFYHLLQTFTINVTEMFRNPSFFTTLRKLLPTTFASQKTIKIWHAGCASGEEVYSMAIILKEIGLYDKTIIYATDIDDVILAKAKAGIYPAESLQKWVKNYQQAGGTAAFTDYYSANYELASVTKSLRENILFTNHNLVTDSVFSEVDLIICRNVMIYFNPLLQDKVLQLFSDSLALGGLLCLGAKETTRLSKNSSLFKNLILAEKIYQKNDNS
jgi:chemotaxis protein methyltransferase CheR